MKKLTGNINVGVQGGYRGDTLQFGGIVTDGHGNGGSANTRGHVNGDGYQNSIPNTAAH